MVNHQAKKFRKLLSENEFLTLPGVYDCLSAKIAEESKFPALFLSGGALAYSRIGRPDIGFLSLSDFADTIMHITSTVTIPLVADADAGFGNAIHSANTGKIYEQLGCAGLQIDDKVLPALRPDKDEILDWNLVAPKIKAIRSAVSEEFVIIYRTCANLYGYGIEESITRINSAKEAGADYAYVDGIKSTEELHRVAKEAKIPLMVNLNEKGYVGGNIAPKDVAVLGFSIGLFPISSMLAASEGMFEVLNELAQSGSTLAVRSRMTDPPTKVHAMMGQFTLVEEFAPFYQ
ncbi:isocitrate lyase/PEP mutase family protein [Levyella massiliensis]|uniref:isocitrate lyase/PEP mutase family protein n=1 Tax=Levyella massiliensis TaxID=938289 RepID=UPI0003770905|nr:isocitrate lyase/PEP mutase family protein [Levyella massiliensis]